jgi:hypothetical protein
VTVLSFFADDITMTADGVDTYHLVKAAGRYKYVTLLFRHGALFCRWTESALIQWSCVNIISILIEFIIFDSGHAMAGVVRCQPLAMENRFNLKLVYMGFVVDKVAVGDSFLSVSFFQYSRLIFYSSMFLLLLLLVLSPATSQCWGPRSICWTLFYPLPTCPFLS